MRLRAWRDDDVALIEHLPVPFLAEEALAWIADQPTWPARGRGWSLAIAESVTDGGIGGIGLVLRHPPGVAELGYWVVPRRRGEGIATRAVGLWCRWALTTATGIHRIHALIEPWNVASRRVAEKNGFVREGLLRAYSTYRGEHRDDVLYALLHSDLP